MGQGFDPVLGAEDMRRGLGLTSMREQVDFSLLYSFFVKYCVSGLTAGAVKR